LETTTTDSNLRDLHERRTEAKGLKEELQKTLDSGSEASKTAPQGFAIKIEESTIENMDNKAITDKTENIPTFAMDPTNGKQ
jgi:hypothetical protein